MKELSGKPGEFQVEPTYQIASQFLSIQGMCSPDQESMIDKYLPVGDLFALYDDDLKSVWVVVPINSETCELNNIAT